LNSFYFGRVPEKAYAEENRLLADKLSSGVYDSSVLYIFVGSDEWELAKKSAKSSGLIGTLDGVPIIAPGLTNCDECDLSTFNNRSVFTPVG
jgi:hypothetical protein